MLKHGVLIVDRLIYFRDCVVELLLYLAHLLVHVLLQILDLLVLVLFSRPGGGRKRKI